MYRVCSRRYHHLLHLRLILQYGRTGHHRMHLRAVLRKTHVPRHSTFTLRRWSSLVHDLFLFSTGQVTDHLFYPTLQSMISPRHIHFADFFNHLSLSSTPLKITDRPAVIIPNHQRMSRTRSFTTSSSGFADPRSRLTSRPIRTSSPPSLGVAYSLSTISITLARLVFLMIIVILSAIVTLLLLSQHRGVYW